MRIHVSEAYREEFEEFISKYQKLCNTIIDQVVTNVSVEKLNTYFIRKHPDVMPRLTGSVSSRDIMRRIVNKCSITNVTSLEEVMQHFNIANGVGMLQLNLFEEGIIQGYQRSLDEYLSKLRARYLLGSSKDITDAEEIIFILDWTPDEASFFSINHLLYEALHHLDKKIIVPYPGKKILHLLLL